MTYHNRMPIGAIGGSDAPTTPPRYVPGRPASGAPVKPLDCRPLSECDTLPLPPDPFALPARHVTVHGWLYWRVMFAWWWLADAWDMLRYEMGWIGQTVLLVLCAVAVVAVALAVVLWGLG